MPFLKHALIAIIIFGAGIAMALTSDESLGASRYYFLAGALGSEFWLFISAIMLRARRLPRFDMIVASESIIALGIFALIWGIVIAATFTLQKVDLTQGLPLEVLKPLLTPFAEGLIAAGFAPLLATTLRHIEVLKYGAEDDEEGTAESAVRAEFQNLRRQVIAASQSFDGLITACERNRAIFEKHATSFDESADAYAAGTAKVQASLDRLSEVIGSRCGDVEANLGALNAELEGHARRLSQSAREMNELTEATRRFKAAAEEGTTLVDGLRSVVASVERFIHPDR